MKYSVKHSNQDIYKITIVPTTEHEKNLLEQPISQIRQIVDQYFDQAVKDKIGEHSTIETIVDDSGLPYQILAIVATVAES